MDPALITVILFGFMLALLASGIWVAMSLLAVGFLALEVFSPAPAGSLLATTVWDASWNWALTALPLFIWMGEVLFRTRLSADMFNGLAPWLSWLPGRLLHVNIVGCGVMAAVAGSSSVTCATVARMSVPELRRRGYDEGLSIGTLAGSGSLQDLAAWISAGLAAANPEFDDDVVTAGMLIFTIGLAGTIAVAQISPRTRLLVPVLCLIVAVLGSIYGGVATPTEAATIGVLGALALAAASRTLTRATFVTSLMGAMRTSCMIGFILVGAAFLSIAMGFTGIPRHLATWVGSLGLSPYMLLFALTIFYVLLGCFLDGVSMMVVSAAVVLPMVTNADIDLLWFGIYVVIVVEMAQITPPVGFNLFVLQSMTGLDIMQVTKAAMPFFFLMVLGIVVITAFPEIVTFLPKLMVSR